MRDVMRLVERQEANRKLDFTASFLPSDDSKNLYFKNDLEYNDEINALIKEMSGLFTGDRPGVRVKFLRDIDVEDYKLHSAHMQVFSPITKHDLFVESPISGSVVSVDTSLLTSNYDFSAIPRDNGAILVLDKPYLYESEFIEFFDLIMIDFPKLGTVLIERDDTKLMGRIMHDKNNLGAMLAAYQAFYEAVMGDEEVTDRATSIAQLMVDIFYQNGFKTPEAVELPVFSIKVPRGMSLKLTENKVLANIVSESPGTEYIYFNTLKLAELGATPQDAPTLAALLIAILDGRKSLDLTYFINGYIDELGKRKGTLY